MKPAEVKRRIAREAKRQIEQQGFTRKRIEQHIRKMLRPRPRWVPRKIWAAIARIVIRGVGELERAELDQAERDLLEWVLDGDNYTYGGSLLIHIQAVRKLRAHLTQSVTQ